MDDLLLLRIAACATPDQMEKLASFFQAAPATAGAQAWDRAGEATKNFLWGTGKLPTGGVSRGVFGRPLHAAGYVAGLPFRPVVGAAKGVARTGAGALLGAGRFLTGTAARAGPLSTAFLGLLGLGGLGVGQAVHRYRPASSTIREATGMIKLNSQAPAVRHALHVRRTMEKQAVRAPTRVRDIFALAGGLALAGSAIGAGSALAQHGIGKLTETAHEAGRENAYKALLKADPTLKDEPIAKKMFEILHRASPYIASEPIIAAATVRSMIDSPLLDERRVKSLLDTEKSRQETRFPILHSKPGVGIKDFSGIS